jgi:hypothetical protein
MLITFEIINWSPIRKLEEDVQAMEAFWDCMKKEGMFESELND